jgi:Tfp pilus assembly protein PilF
VVPAAFAPSRAGAGRNRAAVRILLIGTLITIGSFVWLLSRRSDAEVSLSATELPSPSAPAAFQPAGTVPPLRSSAGTAAHQSTRLPNRTVLDSPASTSDLALALYYQRAGDFAHAGERYRALIDKNELDAQAHNNLGLLYRDRHMLEEAAHELERAALIEPRNAGTRNNFGVTLLELKRPDEALIQFKAALALDPRSVDATVNLALAQRDTGQPALARITLQQALALDPSSAAAHYNLAQMYDRASEAAAALEHYRAFLENTGPEYASRAVAVRERVDALTRHVD